MNLQTELHKRRMNNSMLSLIQQRICPACREEAIKLIASRTWECFKCHEIFVANYNNTPRDTKKPLEYKD